MSSHGGPGTIAIRASPMALSPAVAANATQGAAVCGTATYSSRPITWPAPSSPSAHAASSYVIPFSVNSGMIASVTLNSAAARVSIDASSIQKRRVRTTLATVW
ncbi:hypothetical protein A4X16_07345 [Microbacterium sp. H83]|nr:hypothetical protein A4X16_07345 [Microbacterium sp. H83]